MISRIKLSPSSPEFRDSTDGAIESSFAWPAGTFLQGGSKGVVFSSKGNYRTAFVEAFIPADHPNTGFYRGEGETIHDAEVNAWEKFSKANECEQHEYEARGYTNGGGFCKHCNKFKGTAFTGEDLKQYCFVCKEPTVYSQDKTLVDGVWQEEWYCPAHNGDAMEARYSFLVNNHPLEEQSDRLEFMRLEMLLGYDEEI